MKKLAAFAMAIMLCLCTLALSSCEIIEKFTGKGNEGGDAGLAFTSNGDGTCYVSGIGGHTSPSLDIPELSPEGDTVVGIGASAFEGCEGITSVTMPDSITEIGAKAFSGCTALESISLSAGLKSIGDSAFRDCKSMSKLELPSGLSMIGDSAFRACTALVELAIPDGVGSVGASAFYGCYAIKSLSIGKGVASFGSSAFFGCTSLEDIRFNASAAADLSSEDQIFYNAGKGGNGVKLVIGKDVSSVPAYLFACKSGSAPKLVSIEFENGSICTSIGASAFSGCGGLCDVSIPASLKKVGSGAFSGCTSLARVHLSDIGAWCDIAFGDMEANPVASAKKMYIDGVLIEDLVIPEGTALIRPYAFYKCNSIKSVSVADSVRSIGESAFEGCKSISSVNVGSGVTAIAAKAFSGCSSMQSFEVGTALSSIGRYAFENCTKLMAVALPDTIKTIDSSAFYSCGSLMSIRLGAELQSIGENAFYGCEKLLEVINHSALELIAGKKTNGMVAYNAVDIHTSDSAITTYEGYIFYARGTNRYLLGYTGDETVLVLPDNYKGYAYAIHAYAFYGMTGITSVTIGKDVIKIGNNAFMGCSSLSSVVFTDTKGWWYENTKGSSNVTILSDNLANATTAAKYLKTTYVAKTWNKG